MRLVCLVGLLAGLGLAGGCGDAVNKDMADVSGTVTIDGAPAGNVEVRFLPDGDTKGNGGQAVTDAQGRYEAKTPQGNKGLFPGKYRVVISRRLNPDGTPPKPDEPPIESKARETLPPHYSNPDATTLTAQLAKGEKKPVDFALVTKRRK